MRETLRHNLLPTVVPELKSITVGGAVSGIGIESSSWRYGLVHETVTECEVLLADGTTVVCSPSNDHRDLFYGLPNSYGTLGYILRLTVKLVPAKPFVKLRHIHFDRPAEYFATIAKLVDAGEYEGQPFDYLDGTIFDRDNLYLTVARFVDHAPSVSDYTYRNIYYRSIAKKSRDYLTAHDYIWRWDTDWFWCSSHFGAQNPIIRTILSRRFLRSTTYWKIRHWVQRLRATTTREQPTHQPQRQESVVQDVEIPIERSVEFLDFFVREIGIRPVWVCPLKPGSQADQFVLYRMQPGQQFINFGFWDVVKSKTPHPDGYFNKKIEAKTAKLGGHKSLYSTAYYTPQEFWQLYNRSAYDRLKQRYDSGGRFGNLYQKVTQAGRRR